MENSDSLNKKELQNLDKSSKELGMGGYLDNEISEDSYRKRMSQRKKIQEKRLEKRNKEKGLIIVLTGNGKGKTTSALGTVLRTLGYGHKVSIIQFIKGGWNPGEFKALKVFGENLKWHAFGEGFTWETQNREKDFELVNKSWQLSIDYLKDDSFKLIVLDEINIAMKLGYIKPEKVIEGITKRPELTHVILTGRKAPKQIIEIADLVTEMNLIKHPFKEQGIKAQEGIEF